MNDDGSNLRQITQEAHPALGEDTDPQWSPDGRSIVFQRFNVRTALPVDGIALWIVNLRNGRERQLTPFDLRAGDTPDWSTDGKRILFHSNLDGPTPSRPTCTPSAPTARISANSPSPKAALSSTSARRTHPTAR
jgi:Tol biopolymer transport system component